MKNVFFKFSIIVILILLFTSCSISNQNSSKIEIETESELENGIRVKNDTTFKSKNDTLIAYFTYKENTNLDKITDVNSSASLKIIDGNMMGSAEYLALNLSNYLDEQNIKHDFFSIQSKTEYPNNYDAHIDKIVDDNKNNVKVELCTFIDDVSRYKKIYLVYPIWLNELPLPVKNFLESYDFSNKDIIPLATCNGTSFGKTKEQILDICKCNKETLEEGAFINANVDAFDKNTINKYFNGYYKPRKTIGEALGEN